MLSPDAELALGHLERDRVYVVGGIIDRTVQKHMTLLYAQQHGFEVRVWRGVNRQVQAQCEPDKFQDRPRRALTDSYAQVRKLPLAEHVTFEGEGRPHAKWAVLNVDDVVLALLEYQRTRDWTIACNAAVPARKRRLEPR